MTAATVTTPPPALTPTGAAAAAKSGCIDNDPLFNLDAKHARFHSSSHLIFGDLLGVLLLLWLHSLLLLLMLLPLTQLFLLLQFLLPQPVSPPVLALPPLLVVALHRRRMGAVTMDLCCRVTG